MRKVVITQNITVDGLIEATDDWFTQAGHDPELDAALPAQRDASDGFLVGRVTFESMRDYRGPKTDDTTGVTNHLNRAAKYVVSTTLNRPWMGELNRAVRTAGRGDQAGQGDSRFRHRLHRQYHIVSKFDRG